MSSVFNFFKLGNKNFEAVEKALGQKIIQHDRAGGQMTADAVLDLVKADTALTRNLATSYAEYMTKATATGMRPSQARQEFIRGIVENFPERMVDTPENTRAAYRSASRFLDEATGVGTPAPRAPANIPAAPTNGMSQSAIDALARDAAREARDAAKAAAAATAKAESVISNSILDMNTVRTTNGKMPKQAFFAELQDALRTKNLLTINPENRRTLLTTPNEVFERISQRQSVTEREMGILAEYFGRFHNDAKMAAKEAHIPSSPTNIVGANRTAGVIDAIARRIPVSEGGRTAPTLAQNHAWTSGETSFWLNRASSFQERPIRTLGGYAATAFTAYAIHQTIGTYNHFENPNFLGREVIGIVTSDKNKDVHDFVEFSHSRLNADAPRALANLRKFYGIEKFDDSNGTEVVEALLRGPKPPYNPSPDITQALIMFVSQKVYGKTVTSTADLKNEQNEQVKRANDAIDRIADGDKAQAGAQEQAIANARQTARNAPPPDVFGSLPSGGVPSSGRSTPAAPAQPSYNYTITGQIFKQNLDALKQEGTLNDDLYRKLEKAFKDATKAPVSDSEELTAKNVAKSAEIAAFARAAEGIFSQNNAIPRSAISQVVRELVAPAP
jgi:hypothetical protein